jgi:hypothetical protein
MPSAKAAKSSADEVATDILDEPQAEPQAEPEAPEQAPGTAEPAGPHRTETYEATRPDGTRVRVQRDIDTGEQTVAIL